MSGELHQLADRIRNDLTELERVQARVLEGWQRSKRSGDDYYLDSVALNLHGLYSGLERVFQQIAARVDGFKPTGENWHQALLEQMEKEVLGVRPAVISQKAREQLEEYRGFRHVVRNVYAFSFDLTKLENLIVKAAPLFSRIREELLAFARFLDEQVETDG